MGTGAPSGRWGRRTCGICTSSRSGAEYAPRRVFCHATFAACLELEGAAAEDGAPQLKLALQVVEVSLIEAAGPPPQAEVAQGSTGGEGAAAEEAGGAQPPPTKGATSSGFFSSVGPRRARCPRPPSHRVIVTAVVLVAFLRLHGDVEGSNGRRATSAEVVFVRRAGEGESDRALGGGGKGGGTGGVSVGWAAAMVGIVGAKAGGKVMDNIGKGKEGGGLQCHRVRRAENSDGRKGGEN